MAREGYTDLDYIERFGINNTHAHKETIHNEIAKAIKEESYQAEYESAIKNGKDAKAADIWARKVSEEGYKNAMIHVKKVLADRKKNNLTYPVEPKV